MAYRNLFRAVRPIQRLNRPESFIAFDTETYIQEGEDGVIHFPFRLGVAHYYRLSSNDEYTLRHRLFFEEENDFIDFVASKAGRGKVLPVVAHNVGFDIRVLDIPRRMMDAGWEISLPHMNQRTFMMYAGKGDRKIVFLDTANWGIMSVAALGEEMGHPKTEIDFDSASDDELSDYCNNDVEIISEFVKDYAEFIHNHRLGGFRYTIGAQALAAYRHRFMVHSWYPHAFPAALSLEREGYYGGRTECFFIGHPPGETFYYLDINSFYPSVMRESKIPYRLRSYAEKPTADTFHHMMDSSYVIAKVALETDRPDYPFRLSRRLVFPVGEFTTVLHDPELRRALQAGHVKYVFEAASYDSDYIFTEYVDTLYSLRVGFKEAGQRSWAYVAKLLLNSLYGKFGQRGYEREVVGDAEPNLVWRLVCANRVTDDRYIEVCWGGKVYREYRRGESCYSMPAISGSVTAYGRLKLLEYLTRVPRRSLYYCDTDSLIVNAEGYETLKPYISKNELGMLKIECVADDLVIYGAKDYKIAGVTKTKGVPATSTLTEEGKWEYMQYQGFVSYLNQGAQGGMIARMTQKERRTLYAKGIVTDDGTVVPLRLCPR